MRNLIFFALSCLSITCFATAGRAQVRPEVPTPKSTPSEQSQTQSPVSSSLLSDNSLPTDSANATTRTSQRPGEESNANLMDIYRVGIGDILDVRLLNSPGSTGSTLFTVMGGGVIDFPLAGGAIKVSGFTTDEIQTRLTNELRRRAVVNNAQVSVSVRQYVSHSILITGLVASPGTLVLRREAVPLYVIMAEAQFRNDAGRVTIMSGGSTKGSFDLSDPVALNTTVVNGDVVTVTARTQEFYYIAGRIIYPGQKSYHFGITLLQAVLASGGTTHQNDNKVDISRAGANGRLVTTRFDLKQIRAGEAEDPKLQAGDRILVMH
jgi:protein involved in polysaccharide export with SLBB domain